jgi:hypothetical protein
MTEYDPPLEYEIRRKLRWHRDGANWILFYGRRRMGRVIPDGQRLRMYRVALSSGRLTGMASLSWTKDAVMAAAIRDLIWDAANDPSKCPENRGYSAAQSPPNEIHDQAAGVMP